VVVHPVEFTVAEPGIFVREPTRRKSSESEANLTVQISSLMLVVFDSFVALC